MRNFGLKAFALLLAVVLYWFVTSEGNTTVATRLVAVELENLPNDRIVLSPEQTPQVKVSIRGPNSLVARLTEGPLTFRILLPSSAQDRFVATLEKESLGLPPYLSVLRIDPPEVEYVLDRLLTREVPISVPRLGTLRDSLEIVSISPIPERVSVSGPASELEQLKELDTLPIDLREFTGTATREATLRTPSTLLQVNPRKVSVRVELRVVELERSFDKISVEIRSPSGRSYVATPRAVRVQVKGPRDVVLGLQEEDIQPYVRIMETEASPVADAALTSLKVSIDLPLGVQAVLEPENVSLRLIAAAENAAKPSSAGSKRAKIK